MAARNEQVLELVRQEIAEQPDLGSKALYETARQAYPSLEEDGLKRFHALYVLTAKRERAAANRESGKAPPRAKRKSQRGRGKSEDKAAGDGKPKRRRAAAPGGNTGAGADATTPALQDGASGVNRDHVRGVILQFARDFAAAESRSEIVDVLGKVDEYVDRVVRKGSAA